MVCKLEKRLVGKISEELFGAVNARAARKDKTRQAVKPVDYDAIEVKQPIKVGTVLAALGQKYGGIELDIARDSTPLKAAVFD
jgi:antitoxin FitA